MVPLIAGVTLYELPAIIRLTAQAEQLYCLDHPSFFCLIRRFPAFRGLPLLAGLRRCFGTAGLLGVPPGRCGLVIMTGV